MLWQSESVVEAMSKYKYLIVWIITATIVLAFILGNYYYYLGFFYPDFIVKWTMDLYKPLSQEEVADLETIMNFITSFLAVSIVTIIFLVIKKKLTKRSSRTP